MTKLIALVVWSVLWAALPAADVSGVWNLEMSWESGSNSTGVCTFKQDGAKLTGICGGTEKFPIAGEVKDRTVIWQFDVAQDGSKGRMTFTGVLDEAGTIITGACTIVGAQRGTFTMKKQ
jgi:hypothetical protein